MKDGWREETEVGGRAMVASQNRVDTSPSNEPVPGIRGQLFIVSQIRGMRGRAKTTDAYSGARTAPATTQL